MKTYLLCDGEPGKGEALEGGLLFEPLLTPNGIIGEELLAKREGGRVGEVGVACCCIVGSNGEEVRGGERGIGGW